MYESALQPCCGAHRSLAAGLGSLAALGTAAVLGSPVAEGGLADRLPAADHTVSFLHTHTPARETQTKKG